MVDLSKQKHTKQEQTTIAPGVQSRPITSCHADQLHTQEQDLIAEEVAVAITYNGRSHAVMMASPIDLEDFALGFSLTERIVDSQADILQIEAKQAKQGITLNIQIPSFLLDRLDQKRRQIAGRSGCGICGISDLAEALPTPPTLTTTPSPQHSIIKHAVNKLESHQKLQQQTGAVHAAGLFSKQDGELILLREDVGRHNALDKLIGALLVDDSTRIADCFVLMSSRASHELISKCAQAGINTLVSISASTSLAIDLAQTANINLIGFVRGKRQILYHQSNG